MAQIHEVHKFRAETFRSIGLSLCIPLSSIALQVILTKGFADFDYKSKELIISLALFIIGFKLIDKAYMDLYKLKNKEKHGNFNRNF